MKTDLISTELSKLSNSELENLLKTKVEKETELLIQILHLLAEIERRRFYSKSYPSLFEYCVRELKYSSGSAQRRIDTMRAMKLMPEIEEKLQTGELQMVVVSQAQSFFRQEKKIGKNYDLEAKRQILAKLENKSSRECEKELVAISPQSVSPDRRREIDCSRTEMRITMDRELVAKLDKLKSLLSNKYPHLTDQELVSVLADMALKKLDPSAKPSSSDDKSESKPKPIVSKCTSTVPSILGAQNTKDSYSATEANTKGTVSKSDSSLPTLAPKPKSTDRYIPASMKRAVWTRDHGQCTHPCCFSRHKLQFDHILPLAKGGTTSVSNLRLVCQTHNLLAARGAFGNLFMDKFLQS
jgi:5-methylcytosine-specific restriction endonuclease McrA